MDARFTQTATRETNFNENAFFENDSEIVSARLNKLLAINKKTELERSLYKNDREKTEVLLMKKPLGLEKTFSYFGLMLGTFPPAAFFTKFALESNAFNREEYWIFGILFIVNLLTAVVGYFSGKIVSSMIRTVERFSWINMLMLLPFIGLIWGIMSGGAGGLMIFIIGAFFGAILGGIVGAFALTVFTIFHRLLKKGELIEQKHFLPIAFGLTFTICSFILGL